MSKAQEAIARARRTATEARADATEMASGVVTSYVIGSMEAAGTMAQVPQLMGLPRVVTLAAAAKLVAYNASGNVRQVANGVGNACTHIAVYQFSKGQTVSGLVGAGDAIHDRGRRLEAAGRRSASSELDDLDRTTAGRA
jgi:hypothetical protein